MKKVLLTALLIGVLVTMLMAIPRNKVIVEIGTGTWCQYCPGAALAADDLTANGDPVGIIEYHNGDPYANAASDARNTYYALTGYPTANFDGQNPYIGGNHTTSVYSSYIPRVNARIAIPSHYGIVAEGGSLDNVFNITVTADKVEDDTNTNLRLHAVVTESDIQVNWQGQTELNFVERLMVPNQNGTVLDFTSTNSIEVPLTFTVQPSWVVANMQLVIFIQNNTTKEILQGVRYSLAEIGNANPYSASLISFPDMYLTGSVTRPFTITNYWSTTVTGTLTTDNPSFVVEPATRINFTIPPYTAQTFNVNFEPQLVGNLDGHLNITSNFEATEYQSVSIPLSGVGFFDSAPTAVNVTASGVPVVYQPLTATYEFTDPENNTEGDTSFQWYRIVDDNPVAITNANESIFVPQPSDVGSAFSVEVTPRDQYGMPGTTVMSDPTPVIDVLPAPRNLTAEVINASETQADVHLTWERPEHFDTRAFIGYRVYRDGLIVFTTQNVNLLTFTDTYIWNGDYTYWVTSMFSSPNIQSDPSNEVAVHVGPDATPVEPVAAVSSMMVYPNPFRSNASIMINAKANAAVQVNVYNAKGQKIADLKGRTDANGAANLNWNASSIQEAGIYFVTTKSDQGSLTKKIVLIK